MNSLYGNFRQKKFDDIWDEAEDFVSDYTSSGLCPAVNKITNDSATTLFYLLYARYGNSVIASSDEQQFKFKVFSIIFQYGATWEKNLAVQYRLRNLQEADLIDGAKQINNHSFNPSTAPAIDAFSPLTTVNEQTGTKYTKGILDGYAMLQALLDTDVTGEFLDRFKKLFLTIVEPELPLWYITETEEDPQ